MTIDEQIGYYTKKENQTIEKLRRTQEQINALRKELIDDKLNQSSEYQAEEKKLKRCRSY